jgi:Cof subfamily protein (haloacid dehalogenase superfamily)
MNNIRLIATDLDGTFLRNDKSISLSNLETLHWLGEKGIVRVAATGRNMVKVREVIPDHVPFDFVVYSSGSGVYDFRENRHIHMTSISPASANQLIRFFLSEDISFHAFHPSPDNHLHWYHRGSEPCGEFERYHRRHFMYAEPLPENGTIPTGLSQFLLVFPGNEQKFFRMKERIEAMCDEIRIIRATSPLDTGYIWMEIFHRSVSKGNGVLFLCNRLGIAPDMTMGIGNDYNDIDLLEITAHSFMTDNAPEELKQHFTVLPANEEDAFAHVIDKMKTEWTGI